MSAGFGFNEEILYHINNDSIAKHVTSVITLTHLLMCHNYIQHGGVRWLPARQSHPTLLLLLTIKKFSGTVNAIIQWLS